MINQPVSTALWRFDLRKSNSDAPQNGACLLDAVSWVEYGTRLVVHEDDKTEAPFFRADSGQVRCFMLCYLSVERPAKTIAVPVELRALAARVEQATGADRFLDYDIAKAVGRVPDNAVQMAGFKPDPGQYTTNGMDSKPVQAFSASLDAAVSLVPADHWWQVGRDSSDNSPLKNFGPRAGRCFKAGCSTWAGSGRLVWAATPALALTAAALRALAEEAGG